MVYHRFNTHTHTHLGPWCCLKAKKYHLRRVSNCGSIWGPNKPGRSTFWLVFDLWCNLHEVEFQEPEVRGPENNCGRIIYTCGKVTIKSVDNPFESDVFKQVKSWCSTFLRGYISLGYIVQKDGIWDTIHSYISCISVYRRLPCFTQCSRAKTDVFQQQRFNFPKVQGALNCWFALADLFFQIVV